MFLIKEGKTNWKYLLIVAIIATVVGAGVLWCIKMSEIKIPENIVKDETADWKIYRNEKYGFQFKYPADADIFSESDKPIEMGVLLVPPDSSSTNITVYELKQEAGQRPYNEPTFKVDVVTEAGWLDKNYPDLKFKPSLNLKVFSIKGKEALEAENFDENLYKLLVIEDKEGFNIVVRQNKKTKFLDDIFKTFSLIEKKEKAAVPKILEESFSYPYPISWQENGVNFDLTGISLGEIPAPDNLKKTSGGYYFKGDLVYALTLTLKIKTPPQYISCIPLDFRRELNEEGDMASPNTDQFRFPDTGGCQPVENTTYIDQKIIFVVPDSETKITLTTGGESNIFFTVWVFSSRSNLQLEKNMEGEGLKELTPYSADVSYCYDVHNNRFPTVGIGSDAQIWFVDGGCPHEKYYKVVPGRELKLNVYTQDTSSGCPEYGGTCPCLYPDFSLYEYISGSFEKVKEFNFPDIGSIAESVYYTPSSEKIKIEAEKCFLLEVFQEGETVPVSARADLAPTEITTPYVNDNIEAGDTIYFDSGIKNLGTISTNDFNIKWFVDGVQVGYGGHYGISAGETVMDGNSQYTWTAVTGTHKIKFVVDADNHIRESDETNNGITKTVTVLP